MSKKSDINAHMMKHAFFNPALAKYEMQNVQKLKNLILKRKKQERQNRKKGRK